MKEYHLDIQYEVESILNHWCVQSEYHQEFKTLNQSLMSYGLSGDLKWAPFERLHDIEYLNRLARAVSMHEPRLKHCIIYPMEDEQKNRLITLVVEGEVEYMNEISLWRCVAYCQPIERRFRIT
jgi:predicted component of type VI protein secretion system